jgi:hypothetical protein
MESLTVILAKFLRKHPYSFPYLLACALVVFVLGFHPW